MGILIKNTLAILPTEHGHTVDRHDLYLEGADIAGIEFPELCRRFVAWALE